MIHGVSFNLKGVFYCKKKHYCQKCGGLLEKIKKSQVVNSKSEEAKNYDFQNVDNYMIGNIKFIHLAMRCLDCGNEYTIDEQKQFEKDLIKKLPSKEVDAVVEVTNRRATKTAIRDNYCGCCEIKKDYVTSFVIETADKSEVAYEQTSLCNVSFITPKVYPASLWIGKALEMYEGERIIGEMKIVEILNGSLDRNKVFSDREDILSDYNALNTAIKLSLEWGKEWAKPLENKIMHSIPRLSGNDIQKISDYITAVKDDILWKIYYNHYDCYKQELTIDAKKETAEKYPWINKSNLLSLDSQGMYYAWHG